MEPTMLKKSAKSLLGLVAGAVLLSACGDQKETPAVLPEMLIYCGITMAHPMKEIAQNMEQELGVKILINQGGSEDLYQSLKASQKGDLYLPGSASYRERHMEEGLLGDFVHVGYNQAAMIVPRGNPKGLTADITLLTKPEYKVVIVNPDSGSIGRETKKILDDAGIYQAVLDNATYLTTDSRNLNQALKQGDADVSINWRATAFFAENKPHIQQLDLDPAVAKPKKLVLNLLTFSKIQDKARRFMEYASSPEGQAIFRKYGFLDNTMKGDD
ncbi:MAG: molybdate ABC transporter substrate-binding protein [Alphaproteobacteria bacterium]|nr:molybdate ABC transporter substrate-binding protein [Alphaproteobacteria bacterium]MBF0249039.1 molybdate ABC transporter substrate-binding protein [Alphaproteobacteria bacterium]